VSDRAFATWIGAAVLGGALLRVLYALVVGDAPLLGDGLEFHQQANLLADGLGYSLPGGPAGALRPTADKPPLYPALEALVSLAGGRSPAWHHSVAIACGTATVGVTGLLGRRLSGARAGVLAALLAAAYPLLIAADGSLRSESLYALLVTLALLLALRLRERPTATRGAALGATVALAALTRGEGVALLALAPLALPWRGARREALRPALALVAAFAVVLAPWFARCWVRFDRPVLISTNVGGLVAGANCAPAYRGHLMGGWAFDCLPPPRFANEAREAARQRDVGLRYAREHSGRLPAVLVARVGRSFELFRPREQARDAAFFEGRNLRVEQAGVLVFYATALLALAGLVALRRRRGPWAIAALPVGVVVLVSLTAYGYTRFRVGAEPALVALAACGAMELATRARHHRRPA
jgi:hypothetical protein